MRIIIDTEMQAIIVPDSYFQHVDKLNEIIMECGGNALDYTAYIKTCFDKAYASRIISQTELSSIRGRKRTSAEKKQTKDQE